MMNHSIPTPADPYVPSILSSSFAAAMDGSNNAPQSQKHHLWDWDYNNNNNNSIPQTNTTATAMYSHHNTASSSSSSYPFMDCPLPIPPTNFPFYSLDHYTHHQPANALIKIEEGGGEMGAAGQIGLNLGHRTYFSSGDSLAIDRLFRRSRGMYQLTQQVPRCQAEGCKADLSGAKHYHRRHKVCEFHSKATVVVTAGLQQRFCQQCSRFHVLTEFDEAKRSCRKRLADHNRRRRKPQPAPSSSTTMDTSFPYKSTTSSTEETNNNNSNNKNHATTPHNPRQVHSSRSFAATTTSNGPGLSLGGAEDCARRGREGGGGYGALHSSSYYHYHQQNMSSSSSSATTFYHNSHQHNFFCSSSNGVGAQTIPGGIGPTSDQASNHQSNQQPLHLGQGLFEVDFM